MSSAFLSIMMLAVFALAGGGLWLLRPGGERVKALLMLIAALVLLGNVLLLSL